MMQAPNNNFEITDVENVEQIERENFRYNIFEASYKGKKS
jgi:hypothetical protein